MSKETCGKNPNQLKRIGDVLEKCSYLEVEWTVYDIFSYSKMGECYRSPEFSALGINFYMKIYPCGETEKYSGWISLYLIAEDDDWLCRTGVNYTFGVKKADGTVEKLADVIWMFGEKRRGYGCPEFLERSELLKRKSELASSSNLTLTCTLRINDGFDSAERLDTLSENLKDNFLSQRDCDVTLNVNDQAFRVHKIILAARSPVFAAMLGVDMKEKATGIVDIVDCNPDPFKDFLMYLYSGKINDLSSNAFELYRIADKYQLEELKTACVGSMIGNLSLENVCDAILIGHQSGQSALKITTQEFFNANFANIVPTDEWVSLMKDNTHAANELLTNMSSKIKLID